MTAYFANTHPGLKRGHNEDCYQADAELGLWLVADGVGGHADGEVASAIARDTVQQDLSCGASLVNAIHRAHATILAEIKSRDHSNMGSTIVALQLRAENYEIAWVGDSRAYLFDGDLRLLSRDHNPVSELLALGAITPDQAAVHPERNVLTQSLGVSETIVVTPGLVCGRLRPGEQIMLCSDGLSDELSDEGIATLLRENDSPQSQVEALIEAALKAGGRDNITVVVVGQHEQKPTESTSQRRYGSTKSESSHRETLHHSLHAWHNKKIWILAIAVVAATAVWAFVR